MPTHRRARVIPLPSLDVILARAGQHPLDTGPAGELGMILEGIAGEIVDIARQLATHAGRATVMASDLKLAFDTWKQDRETTDHDNR